MKTKFFIVTLLFMGVSLFAAETQTVSYVLKTAKDYDTVVLQGSFVAQVDDDEFIFQDATGKIKVDISRFTDIQPVIRGLYELDGAKVKIRAVVDKDDPWDRAELDVTKVKVIQPSKANNNFNFISRFSYLRSCL